MALLTKNEKTRWLRAVRAGNVERLEGLLREGVDPGAVLVNGRAAIHIAAEEGQVGVVAMLLAAGDDVDRRDVHGQTPMHLAVGRRRLDMVKFLAEKGAQTSCYTRAFISSTLAIAANVDAHDIIRFLGPIAFPIKPVEDQLCPLNIAVIFGNQETVRALLEVGCDPNYNGQAPQYPIYHAIVRGDIGKTQLLVEHGADERWIRPDLDSRTLKQLICKRNSSENLERILQWFPRLHEVLPELPYSQRTHLR